MKTHISAVALASVVATLALPAAGSAAPGEPRVDQMVVLRSGKVLREKVRAKRATVEVDGRTCAITAATPLAALVRSKPGPIVFHDYGSCSRRPADSSGLFVRVLRGERNSGLNGWVYKVATKLGTAGAADPAGPFGNGRLRNGQRVVWFYCKFDAGSCQRSLAIDREVDGGQVTVTVRGYDDNGDGIPVAGARVFARRGSAKSRFWETDADGKATFTLAIGTYDLWATKKAANPRKSLVPSFMEKVQIR